MQSDAIHIFREKVWEYFDHAGRHDLPWRQPEPDGSFDPYKILVSEIMLQQTQAGRVIPKYNEFLRRFPDVSVLAAAQQGDVLRAWNGLGYNRRAKFLHRAATMIHDEFNGTVPRSVEQLARLPGVGRNTAGAIAAYAYNFPVVFIETNIRTVFIHEFFADAETVPDAELIPLVEGALDREHSREWYWALMDYGTHLKQAVGNLSRRSKHYVKQSAFEGSVRQLRGRVLRVLHDAELTSQELADRIDDERLEAVLESLATEGLIHRRDNRYRL